MAFQDILASLSGTHTGQDYTQPFSARLGALAAGAGNAANNIIDAGGSAVVHGLNTIGGKINDAINGPEAAPTIDDHAPLVPTVLPKPVAPVVPTVANSTPMINQRPISGIHQLEDQTIHDFPFDKMAAGKFADTKFSEPANPQFKGSTAAMNPDNIQGEYKGAGQATYEDARKFLPDSVSSWLADRAKNTGLDPGSIQVKAGAEDGAENVLSHEMMHALFDKSPMNAPGTAGAQAGTAWLNAWDAEKAKTGGQEPDYSQAQDAGPVLHMIDSHIDQSGYDLKDPTSVATERYAYLGQQAMKYGIDVIPKSLQPYYYGVIKGAPAPTPEQLGGGIDPNKGFDVMIGGTDDYTGKKAPASENTGSLKEEPQSPIDKILGKTSYQRMPQQEFDPTKVRMAIASNETGGVPANKAYSFSKPSGSKTMGDDLGKYQVTEGELKSFGKQFLGRDVTKEQFLASPMLQDSYMNNKIKYLQQNGVDNAGILAVHAQGMTGFGNKAKLEGKIKDANTYRAGYVDRGLKYINQG